MKICRGKRSLRKRFRGERFPRVTENFRVAFRAMSFVSKRMPRTKLNISRRTNIMELPPPLADKRDVIDEAEKGLAATPTKKKEGPSASKRVGTKSDMSPTPKKARYDVPTANLPPMNGALQSVRNSIISVATLNRSGILCRSCCC